MSMIVEKIKTSPQWIGDNWKAVLAFAGTVWTVVVVIFTWFTAVNATVDAVPKMQKEITAQAKEYNTLNGKVDTLITLMTFQVLGQKEAAKEYVKTLPSHNP